MSHFIAAKQKQCAAGELPKSQIWMHLSFMNLWFVRKENESMHESDYLYFTKKDTE